jgi:hypothetical protein
LIGTLLVDQFLSQSFAALMAPQSRCCLPVAEPENCLELDLRLKPQINADERRYYDAGRIVGTHIRRESGRLVRERACTLGMSGNSF